MIYPQPPIIILYQCEYIVCSMEIDWKTVIFGVNLGM